MSTFVYKWWHLADCKLLQFIKQQKNHFVIKHARVTNISAEKLQMALVVCHSKTNTHTFSLSHTHSHTHPHTQTHTKIYVSKKNWITSSLLIFSHPGHILTTHLFAYYKQDATMSACVCVCVRVCVCVCVWKMNPQFSEKKLNYFFFSKEVPKCRATISETQMFDLKILTSRETNLLGKYRKFDSRFKNWIFIKDVLQVLAKIVRFLPPFRIN